MSKQRPSKEGDLSYWKRRVYHNTYTRKGRSVPLRAWSVKIQHEGVRRTFRLSSPDRAGAGAEAKELLETISSAGWDGAARQFSSRATRDHKNKLNYWRERLFSRNYPPSSTAELSARIEHGGSLWYFPLGTSAVEEAAKRAAKIYETVLRHGWARAFRSFRREVTIAFHWIHDPLMWTYTTLHTEPSAYTGPQVESQSEHGIVRVTEDDPGLKRVLLRLVHGAPEPQAKGGGSSLLALVNREAARDTISHPDRISTLPDGTPALTYGVHAASEELFALTPGGLSGYVLKRVPREAMLEPINGVLSPSSTIDVLTRAAHSYFQRLLEQDPVADVQPAIARLTRREQDVLELLSKGLVDKQIAHSLGISTWTVHEHVKKIFEKLGVHSRTEAVLTYLQK